MNLVTRVFSSLEGIGIALDSLRANKVRAALTIMGIAVGVFVVVAMSAAIHGIKASVEQDMSSAGPTTFFLFRRGDFFESCDGSDESCPSRRNPPLTITEANALSRLPSVAVVTAHIAGSASFKYKDREIGSANVNAYTPNWVEVDAGDISPGRSFTIAEALSGARVVVINEKMSNRLFNGADPVGKPILVAGKPFEVIGVYHPNQSFIGRPNSDGADDAEAKVPFETGRRYLDLWLRGLDMTIRPRETATRDRAMDDVIAALRSLRALKPAAPNNFAVMGQDKLLEQFNGFTRNFFLFALALASVGLLVGGVGVVAIMMISVTERTREIGVRKALGATRGTILWQFLVEASTLTVIGATVGLAIGALLTWAIRAQTPIPASIPPEAVLAALVGSAITGIFFGIVPALKASRLDPVEALRYE